MATGDNTCDRDCFRIRLPVIRARIELFEIAKGDPKTGGMFFFGLRSILLDFSCTAASGQSILVLSLESAMLTGSALVQPATFQPTTSAALVHVALTGAG